MSAPSDKLFIPASWKKWIAENVLRGNCLDDLKRILVEHGFPEPLVQLEVDAAASHPYIEAAAAMQRAMKKRDGGFDTLRLLQNADATWEVERRENVSRYEFFHEYYHRNCPVILTGAMRGWQAIDRWAAPEYLKERCGDCDVQIQARRDANPRYEIDNESHESTVRFADYVDTVFQSGPTNDYYMTANNADANGRILEALAEDFTLSPQYLDPAAAAGRVFFWFGPAGTVTPLHHDITNNMMAQVVGRKQIKLISPLHQPVLYNHLHCYSEVDLDQIDHDRFPQFRHVKVHEITLHPGEMLFLPVGWWHHVRGLDVTITLTCTHFRAWNDFASFYETYGPIT